MMNPTNKKINDLIRAAAGRDPANIQPGGTEGDAVDQGVAPGLGSADGAAGTNSKPKLSGAARMNQAIRSAAKRRTGGIQ